MRPSLPLRRFITATAVFATVFFSAAVAQENPNLLMGNPSNAKPDPADPNNFLKDYTYFTLSQNNSTGTPNWVSWRLVAADIGSVDRINSFHPDTKLPAGFRAIVPADYNSSGFDRGHMCNFKDRSFSQESALSTFVMTNMVPQSPLLNEHTWEKLEEYCRTLAKTHHHVYIISGPAGHGGEGLIKPSTATKADKIGGPHHDRVTVPLCCWKVILVVDDTPGNDIQKVDEHTRLIAVVMPNNQKLDHDWHRYCVAVREVEKLTGYRFFTAVPANVIEPLKDKVDAELVAVTKVD